MSKLASTFLQVDMIQLHKDMFIKKGKVLKVLCHFIHVLIQNRMMGTILNPAIYVFVKLNYQT